MGTTLDSVAKSGTRKGRLNYSAEFKQLIVAAASEPGASVSKVAMAHQLNANMVFRWRRELGAGAVGIEQESANLLPIVLDGRPTAVALPAPAAQRTTAEPYIEVVIGDACVRISGTPDEAMLRIVFQSLRS
jgi:transposase